jgi:anti-sigma factor RsiW
MGELSHSEIEELLGAYALDAVEAKEAAEIEKHLATCPRCRAELSAHVEVAGLFAYAGQAAPAGLWDRITAGMQETPPELRFDRIRPSMVTPETLVDASPAPIFSLGRRRQPHRRSTGMRVFAATAAAAAVLVAVLGIALVHTREQQHPSATARVTMATVRQALDEKGSRKVVMVSPTGTRASLDAVVTPTGVSYLYDGDLTPLGADRTYQIWGVVGAKRISYGLLGTSPDTAIIRFNAGPGVRALAVTDEVASGVVVSGGPFVVEGAVTPTL